MSIKSKRVIGLIMAVISSITWGLDTVLLGKAAEYNPLNGNWTSFVAGAVPTMIHDLLSACMILLLCFCLCFFSQLKQAFTSRGLFWMILASTCGAPIGMLGYLLAINRIGGGYTAAISALYPAVGSTLAFFILKDKLKLVGWLGLVLAILGTVGIGITAILGNDSTISQPGLGILFAIMCVIGWGAECVIASYSFRYYDLNTTVCLFIRQLTSAVLYNAIVLPIIGSEAYDLIYEMWSDSSIWWIIGASIAGTASYICYYIAIDLLGATQAMAINITYTVWTVIIGLFFSIVPSYVHIIIICIVLICVGSFMCSGIGKEPHPWILMKSWFNCANAEELETLRIAYEAENAPTPDDTM